MWSGFVLNPETAVITEAQRLLVERLVLERISLRGICRAVGVGLQWLLQSMVERFGAAPEHLYVESPRGRPAVILPQLEAERAELWSFVGTRSHSITTLRSLAKTRETNYGSTVTMK